MTLDEVQDRIDKEFPWWEGWRWHTYMTQCGTYHITEIIRGETSFMALSSKGRMDSCYNAMLKGLKYKRECEAHVA